MPQDSSNVTNVEIHGLTYAVRSSLEPAVVNKYAAHVEKKMIDVETDEKAPTDSLKVAVLAALNITDEYFISKGADQSVMPQVLKQVENLEKLIDEALASHA
ncbi:MAG: cell division protein ZapA [Acidobacteriota bacterium]|nr:cell division protein ZapA [Acidobacteriota bacterium]MEE3137866.1 cell division protein ZapA [Acidobacteriota bacterium]